MCSLFTRPTPGQRRRCDGPTPGHTPGYARALVGLRGRATPGSAHVKCGPTPGYRGDARGLPDPPPALGSFRISHRKGTGPKRSGGAWSPPIIPAHHAPPHPATVLARPAACSSFRPLPKPSSWRRSVAACSPCLRRAERPALELPELGKPVLTDLISTFKRDRERGGTAGVTNCAHSN